MLIKNLRVKGVFPCVCSESLVFICGRIQNVPIYPQQSILGTLLELKMLDEETAFSMLNMSWSCENVSQLTSEFRLLTGQKACLPPHSRFSV